MNKFKSIFVLLLLWIPYASMGQMTIEEIKHTGTEIKGRHVTQDYEQDMEQSKQLESILNLDVFTYYGLSERYNTPLQKEVFKKSSDYKEKEVELRKIRQDLLNKKYFVDFEMTYYEQHNLEYNTASHSFDFDIDNTSHSFYNQNNIQIGSLVFSKPQNVLLKNRQFDAAGVDYVRQSIGLVVNDMEKALTVEKNRESLRVLFVFNFTGLKPYKNNVIGFEFQDYFMLTKLEKVILYNVRNGDIYETYTPIIKKK